MSVTGKEGKSDPLGDLSVEVTWLLNLIAHHISLLSNLLHIIGDLVTKGILLDRLGNTPQEPLSKRVARRHVCCRYRPEIPFLRPRKRSPG